MIYDVNSPQYQQFLRSSGRKRDDFSKKKSSGTGTQQVHKPGGAASTGL